MAAVQTRQLLLVQSAGRPEPRDTSTAGSRCQPSDAGVHTVTNLPVPVPCWHGCVSCRIPGALDGREGPEREIFGMAGVPPGARPGKPFGDGEQQTQAQAQLWAQTLGLSTQQDQAPAQQWQLWRAGMLMLWTAPSRQQHSWAPILSPALC